MKVVQDLNVQWISDSWIESPISDQYLVFSVLQIPFDYAVSYRPGTRFGANSIVDALNGYSLYCTDKRISLEHVRLHDLGEVDVVHSFKKTYKNITEKVAAIPLQTMPIFLGGDHSITDPIIRGLQNRLLDRKIGLIVFDAHLDSRPPVKDKEHSGHWMKTLEDTIDYHAVVQLGINASIYSHSYMQTAEANGIMVRTPYEIRKQGWEQTIQAAVDHVSEYADCVYISVDIDCLDQAFAPGTSVPNPNGLQPYEVIDAVFDINKMTEVIGLDITEVSPPLDQQNYTSQVGAQIVLNHIAGNVGRIK